MFLRLRIIVVWLLMAALPLQGFAAATMLFCAAATHDVAQSARHSEQDGSHHSVHRYDAASADAQGTHVHDQAGDLDHDCGLCASCCHNLAIAQPLTLPGVAAVAPGELPGALALLVSGPLPLPERPPRA